LRQPAHRIASEGASGNVIRSASGAELVALAWDAADGTVRGRLLVNGFPQSAYRSVDRSRIGLALPPDAASNHAPA